MADISHQIILTRFFGPSLLISKILVVGFFIYHGFFNKNLSGVVSDELEDMVQKREKKRQEKITRKRKKKGLPIEEDSISENRLPEGKGLTTDAGLTTDENLSEDPVSKDIEDEESKKDENGVKEDNL